MTTRNATQPQANVEIEFEITNTATIAIATNAIVGPLTAEAMEREREARRQMGHMRDRERFREWETGQWPTPEILFWQQDHDANGE